MCEREEFGYSDVNAEIIQGILGRATTEQKMFTKYRKIIV